jgi:Aldehyde dehydrogenase family
MRVSPIRVTDPVSWGDPIIEDEVFGPILPVLTHRTLDEGFSRIAATPRPLAAFIFSREQKTIDRFIAVLSFGGVGPWGMGHYCGKYGFDMLTHVKSMLVSPPDVAIDHLFAPYTPEKNAALAQRYWRARVSQIDSYTTFGPKRRRSTMPIEMSGRQRRGLADACA